MEVSEIILLVWAHCFAPSCFQASVHHDRRLPDSVAEVHESRSDVCSTVLWCLACQVCCVSMRFLDKSQPVINQSCRVSWYLPELHDLWTNSEASPRRRMLSQSKGRCAPESQRFARAATVQGMGAPRDSGGGDLSRSPSGDRSVFTFRSVADLQYVLSDFRPI